MNATDGRPLPPGAARLEGQDVGAAALYLVSVRDQCCGALAGRESCDYQSPPQPLGDAQALVGLLIGRDHVEQIVPGEYVVPVAGGRRTIVFETVS